MNNKQKQKEMEMKVIEIVMDNVTYYFEVPASTEQADLVTAMEVIGGRPKRD